MYISFDPGETTGVVVWSKEGYPQKVEEMKQDELDKFLDSIHPANYKAFIIEKYVVFPHVNHIGSEVETIKVIGQLEAFARRSKIEIVKQDPRIKKVAAMWSQTKVPKGHMPDWMAAYLHGYYYLHQQGIIKAKVLKDK